MRIISGMMLAVVIGLATGCGGSTPPSAEPSTPLPATPTDPPKGDPGAPAPNPAPPASALTASWEMDPAKHATPAAPVTGKLAGAAVTPGVELEGVALRFRMPAGGPAAGATVELWMVEAGKTFEGVKLIVRPDQPAGLDVPRVIVTTGNSTVAPRVLDKGGYALTLEVGKREKGKVPGKVYLSLPGDDKTFLAGTFTADWVRTPAEPPGPDDAPFVQGKLAVTGAAEPNISVGYVRVDPYDPAAPVLDLLGTVLKPDGVPVRSEVNRPRAIVLIPGASAKDAGRFEITRLDPGRYWVFAKLEGGSGAAKWVTVAPGGQVTADFTLDTGGTGGLAVTVSGSAGQVWVLPAAEAGKPWPEALVPTAASMFGLQVETGPGGKPDPAKKDVTVTIPQLAPGEYEVWAGDVVGPNKVTVKAGETAKLTVMSKKP